MRGGPHLPPSGGLQPPPHIPGPCPICAAVCRRFPIPEQVSARGTIVVTPQHTWKGPFWLPSPHTQRTHFCTSLFTYTHLQAAILSHPSPYNHRLSFCTPVGCHFEGTWPCHPSLPVPPPPNLQLEETLFLKSPAAIARQHLAHISQVSTLRGLPTICKHPQNTINPKFLPSGLALPAGTGEPAACLPP